MNLIDAITELINNKSKKENNLTSELLLNIYQKASLSEKEIINKMFWCLTDIQFDTILKEL
jgi:hypothetical protein